MSGILEVAGIAARANFTGVAIALNGSGGRWRANNTAAPPALAPGAWRKKKPRNNSEG
jgi:hypothetical protein